MLKKYISIILVFTMIFMSIVSNPGYAAITDTIDSDGGSSSEVRGSKEDVVIIDGKKYNAWFDWGVVETVYVTVTTKSFTTTFVPDKSKTREEEVVGKNPEPFFERNNEIWKFVPEEIRQRKKYKYVTSTENIYEPIYEEVQIGTEKIKTGEKKETITYYEDNYQWVDEVRQEKEVIADGLWVDTVYGTRTVQIEGTGFYMDPITGEPRGCRPRYRTERYIKERGHFVDKIVIRDITVSVKKNFPIKRTRTEITPIYEYKPKFKKNYLGRRKVDEITTTRKVDDGFEDYVYKEQHYLVTPKKEKVEVNTTTIKVPRKVMGYVMRPDSLREIVVQPDPKPKPPVDDTIQTDKELTSHVELLKLSLRSLVHYGFLDKTKYDSCNLSKENITIDGRNLKFKLLSSDTLNAIHEAYYNFNDFKNISTSDMLVGQLSLQNIQRVPSEELKDLSSIKRQFGFTNSNPTIGNLTTRIVGSASEFVTEGFNEKSKSTITSVFRKIYPKHLRNEFNVGLMLHELFNLMSSKYSGFEHLTNNYCSIRFWLKLSDIANYIDSQELESNLKKENIENTLNMIKHLTFEGYLTKEFYNHALINKYYVKNDELYSVLPETDSDAKLLKRNCKSKRNEEFNLAYSQAMNDLGLTSQNGKLSSNNIQKISNDYDSNINRLSAMIKSRNPSITNLEDYIYQNYVGCSKESLKDFVETQDIVSSLKHEIMTNSGKYGDWNEYHLTAEYYYNNICIFAGISSRKSSVGIKEFASLVPWYFKANDNVRNKALEALMMFEYVHPSDNIIKNVKVKFGKFVDSENHEIPALMSKWRLFEETISNYKVDFIEPENLVRGRIDDGDFLLFEQVRNHLNKNLAAVPYEFYPVYDGTSPYLNQTNNSRILLNDLMIKTSLVSSIEGKIADDTIFNAVRSLKKKYTSGEFTLENQLGILSDSENVLVGIPTWQMILDYTKNHRNNLNDSTLIYNIFTALVDMEYLNDSNFNNIIALTSNELKNEFDLCLVLDDDGYYDLYDKNTNIKKADGAANLGKEVARSLYMDEALTLFANDMIDAKAEDIYLNTSNHMSKAFIDSLLFEHARLKKLYDDNVENASFYDYSILYEGEALPVIGKLKDRLIELKYFDIMTPTIGASTYDKELANEIKDYKMKNSSRHYLYNKTTENASKYIGKLTILKMFYETSVEKYTDENVDGLLNRLLVFVPSVIKGFAQEFLDNFTFVGIITMIQSAVSFTQAALTSLSGLFEGIVSYVASIPGKIVRLFDKNQSISQSEITELGLIIGTVVSIGFASVVRPDAIAIGIAKLGRLFTSITEVPSKVIDNIKILANNQLGKFRSISRSGIDTVQSFAPTVNNVKTSLKTLLNKIGDYKAGQISKLKALSLNNIEVRLLIDKFIGENRAAYKDELTYLFKMVESNGCLVGETLVHTEDGYRPIKDIQIGDKVLSFDEKTKAVSFKEVYDVFEGVKRDIYWIRTNTSLIKATEEHPFYVEGKGWVEASALSTNDILVDDQMVSQPIVSIKKEVTEGTKIYNLSVIDNHSFYVSRANILTHNENCKNLTEVIKEIFSSDGALEYEDLLEEIAKIENFETSVTDIDNAIAFTKNHPNDSIVQQVAADLISAKRTRSLLNKVIVNNQFDSSTINRVKALLMEKKISLDEIRVLKNNILESNDIIVDMGDHVYEDLDWMIFNGITSFNRHELSTMLERVNRSTFLKDSGASNYISEIFSGSRKYFNTTEGGRYIEVLADGIAHETNVGYHSLTQSTRKKIDKDVLIRNSSDEVQVVVWHFFDDGTSKRQGPSKPLKEYLENNGIEVKIYEGTSKLIANISDEMGQKILYGARKVDGKNVLIGGHSAKILDNPNFAAEVLSTNADGTKLVQFTTQFADGNLSKLKKSTLFPESWSDDAILKAVKEIGETPSIGKRLSDGTTLHRGVVNGVQVEVMKIGDAVTSGYPTGGGVTGLLSGFE